MNIATLSISRVIGTLVLICVLGLLTTQTLSLQSELVAAEARRFRSHQLAEAMRLSSDELSRMARSYVITGDTRYRQHYYAILDQRNGKQPSFWSETISRWDMAAPLPAPLGLDGVSLPELMRREGFTRQEFALLSEAQQRSDTLVKLEEQAFAAIEKYKNEVSPAARAEREWAINLLHDANYHTEKARIMAPIRRFLDVVNQRTSMELAKLQREQRNYLWFAMALTASLFVGLLLFTLYIRRKILQPLKLLKQHASALSRGAYASRVYISSRNELALLGRTFNQMAEAIESDMAAKQRLQAELETLARTDFLTQLANRRYFIELAEAALARMRRTGESVAVCMLDIDHFKAINDRYGHGVGDLALQQLAEVMRRTLREIDLSGRLGGEEFALLLPETEVVEALRAAERLCEAVAAIYMPLHGGHFISFTVSIGVTVTSDGCDELDTLLRQADDALYEAKRCGRNQVRVWNGDDAVAE